MIKFFTQNQQVKLIFHRNASPIFQNYTNQFKDYRHRHLKRIATRDNFQSYFNKQQAKIGSTANTIINQIAQFEKDSKNIEASLNTYLDIMATTNKMLEPKDLLSLLVAINMHGDQKMLKYRRPIMEHLIRQDIELLQMDELMVICLIDAFTEMTKSIYQKKKLQHVTFMFFSVLKNNFQKVNFRFYNDIMRLLLSEDSSKLTFMQFAHILQQGIINLLQMIRKKYTTQRQMEGVVYSEQFLSNALTLFSKFNCKNGNFDILYQTIDQRVFEGQRLSQLFTLDNVLKIYRLLPARERSQDGIFYKRQFLNKLLLHLQKIRFEKGQTYLKNHHYFCSSVIHHLFYQHWMNLTFCQKDDLIYLEKDQITTAPKLPELFWKIYQHNASAINFTMVTRDTIKNCYPERYQETEIQKPRQTKIPFVQTEMKIRMEMVLLKKKLTFRKEVNISNRFIDFLLEGDIILELDGMHHFHPYHFENDDATAYRNIHLLMAGYRLIIINIHQYNSHRQVDQLAELFQQKFNLLKQSQCALVS